MNMGAADKLNIQLTSINFLFLFKIALVIGVATFVLYTLVSFRQVGFLSSALRTKASPLLRLVAMINFAIAAALLFAVIFYL